MVQGEGSMDRQDWSGLTLRTRDGTVLGVVVGVFTTRAHLLLLAGEPGIGKSRLLEAAVQRALT
jgi:predicted ATP-dependent serine protease